MGWHDVTIHGICVQPSTSPDNPLPRLLLDIDYIVRWVHPVAPEQHFTFWIAPSTLAFEDVWDFEGDLAFGGMALHLDIDRLHRSAPDDGRGGPVHGSDPGWHIEGHYFDLRFRATGYHQYVRQAPLHSKRLVLTHHDRGGLGFAETAFA
ncbi:hypothetical protein AB0C76_27435 [Kitasatospora sp. NPDC048722]|uniref:hypothetical protein n=1 Tax=Kitasatospora sp. NPDC048722 TaxID=3155639 RepID=UPI003405338D